MDTKKFKIAISFIVLIAVFQHINAQKNTLLKGIVKNDSVGLENIHVINKTTNLATYSNNSGKFIVEVKLGDSIEFSSINYTNRTIKISKNHIDNNFIIVYLEEEIESLGEVNIVHKIPFNISNINVLPNKQINHSKYNSFGAPDMNKVTDPTASNNSVNFISIYHMLTKNMRLKRKAKAKNEANLKIIKQQFLQNIKTSFGENIFTNYLNIPKHEIDLFIDYCSSKGLVEMYDNEDIIVLNFLIKQSKVFNSLKN